MALPAVVLPAVALPPSHPMVRQLCRAQASLPQVTHLPRAVDTVAGRLTVLAVGARPLALAGTAMGALRRTAWVPLTQAPAAWT